VDDSLTSTNPWNIAVGRDPTNRLMFLTFGFPLLRECGPALPFGQLPDRHKEERHASTTPATFSPEIRESQTRPKSRIETGHFSFGGGEAERKLSFLRALQIVR
jgi:hypothetical protein